MFPWLEVCPEPLGQNGKIENHSYASENITTQPPSFENFDAAPPRAGLPPARLSPTGTRCGSHTRQASLRAQRLLDAPSHHVSPEETIEISKSYEFLVLLPARPATPATSARRRNQEGQPDHQDRLRRPARQRPPRTHSARRRQPSISFAARNSIPQSSNSPTANR